LLRGYLPYTCSFGRMAYYKDWILNPVSIHETIPAFFYTAKILV